MPELNEVERQKLESILHGLPRWHPAHRALDEGRSIVAIAHCIEGMRPDVLVPLLELNVHHQRRLRSNRPQRPHQRRRVHRFGGLMPAKVFR